MIQAVRNRRQFCVNCVFVSTLLFAVPTSLWAQKSPKAVARRPFRENVTLPIDSNLLKRFGTAEDLLADRRWEEAIGILQEIAQTENKGLVQIQSGIVGRGVATYLNVATRCNILMSQITPEGLANYRQKIDPQAKRWFENWQRTRDETELLRIVRQAYLSHHGDVALIALGEAAWDRGDFSTARQWWQQLIPLPDDAIRGDYPTVLKYPDAAIDQPTILARIALCSILERESARADEDVRLFSEKYPLAEGWLAGQKGRLADLLQHELDDSRRWPAVKNAADVETFGVSPSRFRLIPESVDVGGLRWVRPLSPSALPHPVEGFPFQNEPLNYHPVVYDNIVLVNDPDSIRAWNILTGEPAWPSDQNDPAAIYPTVAEEPTAVPDKICVGVPHFTMTISGSRLYARMGSPVTCASTLPQRDLESDLVCLDLNQEGKLVWKIPARKLFNEGSWRFEGTPLIVSGRAYVTVCRRRPQLELMVACLDASDGRLLWQRPIGGFRASVDDSQNRVSHLLLTAGGGRIFLNSDAGAIVALNALDGRFEWVISYESRSEETPATLSDPSQKGLLPAMFHGGWLIVAPNDADSAFCIEADSGRVRWQYSYVTNSSQDLPDVLKRELQAGQRRENQWRYLLGVAPGGSAGRVIASGKSLVAIDIESGLKIWETPRSAFGRGLLAGDQVLLPGRMSIEICSQQSGQLIRTILLKTPETAQQGGNLTLANGMLLVAQPKRLAAYSEYSQLKERIERDLTFQPNNATLLIQLGELEAAEGDRAAAEMAFQRVIDHVYPKNSNYITARQKLAKLWQVAGQSAFDQANFFEAREYWLKSLSIMDDFAKRLELIFSLASTDEKLDCPNAVLARLQMILDDEQLASFPLGGMTAGHEAAVRMSRLIDDHGREAYEEIEIAASKELEELKPKATTGDLRRFIQRFPHANVVANARQALAQSFRSAGEIPEAYAVLDEIRQNAVGDQAFVQSTLNTIELLEEADDGRPAMRLRETLAVYEPTFEVEIAGMKQTLGQSLANRRKSLSDIAQSRPLNLERTWVHPLSADMSVIVPENESPSPKQACVLVCTKHDQLPNAWSWQCLDWRTGRIRWEETASSPIQIARWTPVQLLIGTPNGWQARAPENGRRVWGQNTSPSDLNPVFAMQSTEVGEEIAWPALFGADRGFQLFDPNDGRLVSRLKPPGRMHGLFAIGSPRNLGFSQRGATKAAEKDPRESVEATRRSSTDESLVAFFQTSKPTRTWLATASSLRKPWSIQEISSGGEPWRAAPFTVGNRIVGMTREHHLVGFEIAEKPPDTRNSSNASVSDNSDPNVEIVEFLRHPNSNGEVANLDDVRNQNFPRRLRSTNGVEVKERDTTPNQWEYRNFAIGQAAPFAWVQNGELLVAGDGSLLMSFNPANGRRKWTVGLADFPIQSPDRQICILGDTVFAVSQGRLRGINAHNGKCRIERYLGDVSPQWQTSVVWNSRRNSASSAGSPKGDSAGVREGLLAIWPLKVPNASGSTILFCDVESGEITQRLRVDSEPRKLVIDRDGVGLVWTEKSLSGLQPTAY